MSKRPSGGQRTAAERQAALRARREKDGLVQVPVWVPDGKQAEIRAMAADLRAAEQREGKQMYDVEQLARAIDMAMDSAAAESTESEDVHYDVRWENDRGLYIVLREHADSGRVLWSTVTGFEPPHDAARRVVKEENEWLELERG